MKFPTDWWLQTVVLSVAKWEVDEGQDQNQDDDDDGDDGDDDDDYDSWLIIIMLVLFDFFTYYVPAVQTVFCCHFDMASFVGKMMGSTMKPVAVHTPKEKMPFLSTKRCTKGKGAITCYNPSYPIMIITYKPLL